MTKLPCIYTPDESATVFLGNKSVSVVKGQPHFNEVMKAIQSEDWDEVAKLADMINAVKNFLGKSGKFEINRNEIRFNGEIVKNVVCDRILNFMEKGFPADSLVLFLEKLVSNPSYNSQKQLYTFLERWNLPITPNGNFLAYKAVRLDYMSITADHNTGERVDNSIGKVIKMDRSKIDDNANKHCSAGLHAGALSYVRSFGGFHGETAINDTNRGIIVEINPRDVVSVPNDCDCQKMRLCEYRVVGDYVGKLPEDYIGVGYDGYDDLDEGESYDEDYCPDCGEHYDNCDCGY